MSTQYSYNSKEALQVAKIDSLLDLFYKVGLMGTDIKSDLISSYEKEPTLTTKCMMWSRDIRGGASIRKHWITFLKLMHKKSPQWIYDNLDTIVNIGYWPDLFHIIDDVIIDYWCKKLPTDNLAKKWAPRLKSKHDDVAKRFVNSLQITNKQYRQLIKEYVTVESKMAKGLWEDIDIGKMPGKALTKYRTALKKKHPEWDRWLSDGKSNANANVLFPHEVLMTGISGDIKLSDKLWTSLPKYFSDDSVILPMIDVSGSMEWDEGSINGMTLLIIAIAIGAYCSNNNIGDAHGKFLTFSENPVLISSPKNIKESVYNTYKNIMQQFPVGYSTNFERGYNHLLGAIKSGMLKTVPTHILVISDMEFDEANHGNGLHIDNIKQKWTDAGLEFPKLIFWNLASHGTGYPSRDSDDNVILMSGFSTSILKNILSLNMEKLNPMTAMISIIEKYEFNENNLPKTITL